MNFSADTNKPTYAKTYSWQAQSNPSITFTFADPQTIAEFAYWNAGLYAGRGLKTAQIQTQDATTMEWTTQLVPTGYTGEGGATWTFAQAGGTSTEPGQSFVLSADWTNVQAVRFVSMTNQSGERHLNLGKVRFYLSEVSPATGLLITVSSVDENKRPAYRWGRSALLPRTHCSTIRWSKVGGIRTTAT